MGQRLRLADAPLGMSGGRDALGPRATKQHRPTGGSVANRPSSSGYCGPTVEPRRPVFTAHWPPGKGFAPLGRNIWRRACPALATHPLLFRRESPGRAIPSTYRPAANKAPSAEAAVVWGRACPNVNATAGRKRKLPSGMDGSFPTARTLHRQPDNHDPATSGRAALSFPFPCRRPRARCLFRRSSAARTLATPSRASRSGPGRAERRRSRYSRSSNR